MRKLHLLIILFLIFFGKEVYARSDIFEYEVTAAAVTNDEQKLIYIYSFQMMFRINFLKIMNLDDKTEILSLNLDSLLSSVSLYDDPYQKMIMQIAVSSNDKYAAFLAPNDSILLLDLQDSGIKLLASGPREDINNWEEDYHLFFTDNDSCLAYCFYSDRDKIYKIQKFNIYSGELVHEDGIPGVSALAINITKNLEFMVNNMNYRSGPVFYNLVTGTKDTLYIEEPVIVTEDGSTAFYMSNDTLFAYNIKKREIEDKKQLDFSISEYDHELYLNSDESKLILINKTRNGDLVRDSVYVIDLDGYEIIKRFKFESASRHHTISWDRSIEKFTFVSTFSEMINMATSFYAVTLIDLKGLLPIYRIPRFHLCEIDEYEYSPDEKYFLSRSTDDFIFVWNAEKNEVIRSLYDGRPVGFSPDEEKLVFADSNFIEIIKLADMKTGTKIPVEDSVYKILSNSVRNEIVLAGRDNIYVFDGTSYNLEKEFDSEGRIFDELKFSYDGDMLIAIDSNYYSFTDLNTGIKTNSGPTLYEITDISDDGIYYASGGIVYSVMENDTVFDIPDSVLGAGKTYFIPNSNYVLQYGWQGSFSEHDYGYQVSDFKTGKTKCGRMKYDMRTEGWSLGEVYKLSPHGRYLGLSRNFLGTVGSVNNMKICRITGVEDSRNPEINSINYPNPFRSKTTIKFCLDKASSVQIDIYSILGIKISSSGIMHYCAGENEYSWNAGNNPPGIYFYRVVSDNKLLASGSMVLE